MAMTGDPFKAIRESALTRLRLSEAPAAAMRQQAINVAGLRTSGVGQLPLMEAARSRLLAQAGIEQSLAEKSADQLAAERLAKMQNQFALEQQANMARLGLGMESTLGRQGFQSGLISRGLGIGGDILKKALPLIPGLGWLGAVPSVVDAATQKQPVR